VLDYQRLYLRVVSRANTLIAVIRLSMSAGHPRLTTGIPVGKPTGMETHGSELLVVIGLHGSGCSFSVLQVLATSTREIKVLFIYFTNLIYYCITHLLFFRL
jgi:hypothetical protein